MNRKMKKYVYIKLNLPSGAMYSKKINYNYICKLSYKYKICEDHIYFYYLPSVPTNEFVLRLAIHDLVSIDGGYKYEKKGEILKFL